MKATPIPINTSLENDISSAILINPIIIVEIKITGPTTANMELTTTAFFTSFNISIIIAALISMRPETRRNPAMESTADSMDVPKIFFITSPPIHS